MPAPKTAYARAMWERKLSKVAKEKGFGKWMKGKKPSEETKAKMRESLKKTCNTPYQKKKRSQIAKKGGYGKWMKGRPAPAKFIASAKARKGKTYKEIYGVRWKEEAKKRRDSNRARWVGKKKKQRDKHNGEARYKKWRNRVFKRDDWKCQICWQRGGTLNAHHIKSWARYIDLRYMTNNGITLCEDCHKETHKKKT